MVRCGAFRSLAPMNGEYYTDFELEQRVGGTPKIYRLNEDKVLVVDDDGKGKGRMYNNIATGWLRTSGIDDFVCGDALLISTTRLR